MQRVQTYLVRAFGEDERSGNPAGVVPDAKGLAVAERQRLASQLGHSETAFIEPASDGDFRIQFFTPTKEIDNCGHATIASFFLLRHLGRISTPSVGVTNNAGRLRVHFDGDGRVFMEQRAPQYTAVEEPGVKAALARSLGMEPSAFTALTAPTIVSTGNRFFIAGVQDETALAAVRPQHSSIAELSRDLNLIGYYVFTRKPGDGAVAASARMFAPYYGIPEESGTGMAAGPLACLLRDALGEPRTSMTIEQGRYMSPPSISRIDVRLELDAGRIAGLLVGGRAFVVG